LRPRFASGSSAATSATAVTMAVRPSAKKKNGIDPLKEADLSRHLDNGNGKKKDKKNGKGVDTEQMLKDDYMLYEALNLLKGLAILQARIQ